MVNNLLVLGCILVFLLIYLNLNSTKENFQVPDDILSMIEKVGSSSINKDDDEIKLKEDILDTSDNLIKTGSSVSNKVVSDDVLKEFVIKQLGPRTGGNNDNILLSGENKSSLDLNTNLDLDKVIKENSHKIFSKITNQNMMLKNIKLELLKLIHSDVDPTILRKRKACLDKK
jgi:hypothetical protein